MEQQIDVKTIRDQLGLTQGQLAEAVGVTQSTVSLWETKTTLPRGPARKILLSLIAQPERAA